MPNTSSRSRFRAFLLLASLALAAAGCMTEPLVAPPPVLAAETPAQTRAAILRALIEHDYVVVSEQPGEIVARYSKTEWNMVVAIDYSNEVRVRYVSSENLDYGSEKGVTVIHGGYNKRVDRLSKRIGTEVAILRAASALPPVAAPPADPNRTQ